MNRKSLYALAGAVVLSITAIAGYAANGGRDAGDGPRHHGGPGMGFMFPGTMGPELLHRLGDKLALTDEQRQTIKGLLESARPNMDAMRQEMRSNAEQLRTTQPDDPNYAAVVAQASQKAGELASRMVTDGSQLRAQIWQVLTPEQRTQLQTLQSQFRERMQERRKHRGGPSSDSAPAANKTSSATARSSSRIASSIPTIVVTATRLPV